MSQSRAIEIHVDLGIEQAFEVVACRIEEGSRHRLREDRGHQHGRPRPGELLTARRRLVLLVDGMEERRWTPQGRSAAFLGGQGRLAPLRGRALLDRVDHAAHQ